MTHIIMVLEGRYTVGDSLRFVGKVGNAVWAENQIRCLPNKPAHTATLRLARVGRNAQSLIVYLPAGWCAFLSTRNRLTPGCFGVRADLSTTGSFLRNCAHQTPLHGGGGAGGEGLDRLRPLVFV